MNDKNKSKWQKLWASSKNKWLFGIPLGGFLAVIVGATALGGFNGVMHVTNSNQFCYSCHIGMDTIVEEYQASRHFNNATGVQASCADCHVPKEFLPKMWTKVRATKDIYHKLVGTVNLENFEEQRLHQAEYVWKVMIARDSQECRNCHQASTWSTDKQSLRARQHHLGEMVTDDKTCIDCHIGVAHSKPAIR